MHIDRVHEQIKKYKLKDIKMAVQFLKLGHWHEK